MPKVELNLAQHSYTDRSPSVSVQRLINLEMAPKSAESRTRYVLESTPALKLWATCSAGGGCRGLIVMASNLYAVIGNGLYRYDALKNETFIGSIPGNQPVKMQENGTQIAIVADGTVYIATDSTLSTAPTSPAAGVSYLDGYFAFAELGTQKLYISAIYDGMTYDPTEFTLVNADPDNNVGQVVLNQEIIVFGTRSAQAYYNSGQADFPFARNRSAIIPRGAVSRDSIAEHAGVCAWLADDKAVYAMQGGSITRVSTPAIDYQISRYSGAAGARGFIYALDGKVVYCLSFGDATIAYDFTSQRWHERKSLNLDYWRAREHALFNQKNLVGDVSNGKIYELDPDGWDDDGDAFTREVITAPIFSKEDRNHMHTLELLAEVGVGVTTGQGSSPQVMMQWSDDNGRTWSNERMADLGALGVYSKRVRWTRLGQFRTRVLRFAVSDPVKVTLLSAYADIEGGAE